MVTLLIVDDERAEREGLRFLLQKKQYDVRILEAENGEQALSVLQTEPIDILISDIRMPFMDGLTLSERARALLPDLIIMIYSAFGEFEYARQAIQVNVLSYLLKPLKPAQFYQEMDRALTHMDELRARRALDAGTLDLRRIDRLIRERYWYDLLHGQPADPDVTRHMREAGVRPEEMHPYLMLIHFQNAFYSEHTQSFEAELCEGAQGYWLLDPSAMLLLHATLRPMEDEQLLNEGRSMVERIATRYGVRPSVLIARADSSGQALSAALRHLEEQYTNRIFQPGSVLLCEPGAPRGDGDIYDALACIRDSVREAFLRGNTRQAQALLMRLHDLLGEAADISALYVKYALTEIIEEVRAFLGEEYDRRGLFDTIWGMDTLEPLRAMLRRYGGALAQAGALPPASEDNVVGKALTLIHERYDQDLSLESIASSVYMTPSYFSYVFKRQTGQTLIKYLTRHRLSRAAQLLRSGDMRVTDIMLSVGYSNPSYFSSLFRAEYGQTPSQYKKHAGGRPQ